LTIKIGGKTLEIINKKTLTNISKIIAEIDESSYKLKKLPSGSDPTQDDFSLLNSLYVAFGNTFKDIQTVFVGVYNKSISSMIQSVSNRIAIKKIGIKLLKNRIIEKPIKKIHHIPSISMKYWDRILINIKNTKSFHNTFQNLHHFYKNMLDKEIEERLKKIPIDIDKKIKEEYSRYYYATSNSFDQFLSNMDQKENNFGAEKQVDLTNSENIRSQYENALEKKKLDKKKEEQTQSFDNYEAYFQLNERELKRAKRIGKISKRKYSKKTRRRSE
jgi:hypothetical protein